MVGAISAITSYYRTPRIVGPFATVSWGPRPLRPVERPTPTLPPKRVMVYQLRPQGLVLRRLRHLGGKLDLST